MMRDDTAPPAAAEPPADSYARAWQSPLWRRQALVLAGLVAGCVGGLGVMELRAWYQAATRQAFEVQLAQAHEAMQAVRGALATIERQVLAVTALPWSSGAWLTQAARREEYGRLLRLVPAIESVTYLDADNHEVMHVSRKSVDRMADVDHTAVGQPSGAPPTALRSVSSIQYANDHDPVLTLKLRFLDGAAAGATSHPAQAETPHGRAAGTTVVTLGMRAMARELRPALEGGDAAVFVVDQAGRVILHRDPQALLERRQLPPARESHPGGAAVTERARALDGGADVLRSVLPIEQTDWRVVVEQPRARVMEPVWAALQRTASLVGVGIAGSVAAAMYLAGHLTRPIRRLHAAATRLAAERFDPPAHVHTRDEMQEVAEQFNRMADSLQQSYAQLEDKVAEKTRDLALANRRLSEFMANMSHELRTPLNAVIGMSEALQDEGDYGGLNDKQREYLADINASGEHLLSLINDLLDLAKIEAGRVDLEREPIDVGSAIADAATLLRERAQQQRVTITNEVDPAAGVVWSADPRRFKQIVVNLLGNAVKFTPAGGAVVLRAGVQAQALWVEVQDSGCGIALEDQRMIFEKFGRVGDARRHTEGTGLGLSVVSELVRLHGGEISVASELGVGSSFRFTIPAPAAGEDVS